MADAPYREELFGGIHGLTGYSERHVPSFTRYSGNPILSAASQNPASGKTPSTSLYWPYVVNAGAIPGLNPAADWFMYYTTDHDAGAGGVYLAYADSPYGPWQSQGKVFVDTAGSAVQTENASVIWNDDESLFFMFYKVINTTGSVLSDMVTGLATSPDGITWTRVGVVVDVPAAYMYPGNGQNSYVRPFRIGRQWWMHFMVGGGTTPVWAIAQSHDGRTWQVDGRPIMYGCDALVDTSAAVTPLTQNALRVEWNSGDVVWWQGRLWWVGIVSNFTAGATAKNARMACAPIAANLRTLLGPVQYILHPPSGSSESVDYRAVHTHVYGGRLFLTYQCGTYFNLAVSD